MGFERHATKQKGQGGAESVFYTWFFGNFVALAGVWGGYEALIALVVWPN